MKALSIVGLIPLSVCISIVAMSDSQLDMLRQDSVIDILRQDDEQTVLDKWFGAAKDGDVVTVKAILALKSVEVNQKEEYKEKTALHRAAKKGHFDVVQYLIQSGASVHLRNSNGNTPLYCIAMACRHSFTKSVSYKDKLLRIMELLLKSGADVHCQKRGERSVLGHLLIVDRDCGSNALTRKAITLLLEHCSKIPYGIIGIPLHTQQLLDDYKDSYLTIHNGSITGLYEYYVAPYGWFQAVENNDKDAMHTFLDSNAAEVNDKNHDQETAIDIAVKKGHEEIIQFLIEQGSKMPGGMSLIRCLNVC